MNIAIVVFASLISAASVSSGPDESVIKEMSQRTNLEPHVIRQNYDACDSGANFTMKICGYYRWLVEDTRLNSIYKLVLAQAKELGYKDSLVQSQRAWIAYRDTTCALEGKFGAGGGSSEVLYIHSCKEALTKERANRLSAMSVAGG